MTIDVNTFELFSFVAKTIDNFNKSSGDFDRFDEEIKLKTVKDFLQKVFGLTLIIETTKSEYFDELITDWKIEKI